MSAVQHPVHSKSLKFLWIGGLFFLFLLLLPTAYRSIKNWRAHDLVSKSWVAFALADSPLGVELLRQAQALAPGSLSTQRGIELYNAKMGDGHALQSLLTQMRSHSLESGELLGIAEIESNAGGEREAMEALSLLPKQLGKWGRLRRTLVESRLLANQGKFSQASSLTLSAASSSGALASGLLRIQGALYLLALHDEALMQAASEILQAVAQEGTEASLLAWRIAVHRVLSSSHPSSQSCDPSTAQEIKKLLHLFPLIPKSAIDDHLLATEMELRIDPAQRDQVLAKLIGQYQQSDRSSMLTLARWLNVQGLSAQVITLAGQERPRSDTAWLLVILDAISAQGEWSKIAPLLDSPAALGIPDAVRYLFLARSATMMDDHAAAEAAWSSVRASLPLEKPETLAYIAGYEEQIGEWDQAVKTYREMARRETTRVAGLVALLRMQPSSTPAITLIPLYEELLVASPHFPDAAGDLDYLKLLIGKEVVRSTADAEKQLQAQPNSLARISAAALGYLRQGDLQKAQSLYEGKQIDWSAAPASWRVVRSALLRATGDLRGAHEMDSSIDRSKLRPEESALLQEKSTQFP
jgi:tetratricopeptide (TPR) repeat protein